jgi:hypothetical protein
LYHFEQTISIDNLQLFGNEANFCKICEMCRYERADVIKKCVIKICVTRVKTRFKSMRIKERAFQIKICETRVKTRFKSMKTKERAFQIKICETRVKTRFKSMKTKAKEFPIKKGEQ